MQFFNSCAFLLFFFSPLFFSTVTYFPIVLIFAINSIILILHCILQNHLLILILFSIVFNYFFILIIIHTGWYDSSSSHSPPNWCWYLPLSHFSLIHSQSNISKKIGTITSPLFFLSKPSLKIFILSLLFVNITIPIFINLTPNF